MCVFLHSLVFALAFATERKFQDLPLDVLEIVGTCLYYKDRRTFLTLSNSCWSALRSLRHQHGDALHDLIDRIAHSTGGSFQLDFAVISWTSNEMRVLGHPRYFSELPHLIDLIQRSKFDEIETRFLFDALGLVGNENFVTSDEALGDLSEELRLLIVTSRGIFDYFENKLSIGSFKPCELRIPVLMMRHDGDLCWHCSSSLPLRFAILYQYLIPHFHNLTADEQFKLVNRYNFIPWRTKTMQGMKEECCTTHCDFRDVSHLNRVNLIVGAEHNTLEIDVSQQRTRPLNDHTLEIRRDHWSVAAVERRSRRVLYCALGCTLVIVISAIILALTHP